MSLRSIRVTVVLHHLAKIGPAWPPRQTNCAAAPDGASIGTVAASPVAITRPRGVPPASALLAGNPARLPGGFRPACAHAGCVIVFRRTIAASNANIQPPTGPAIATRACLLLNLSVIRTLFAGAPMEQFSSSAVNGQQIDSIRTGVSSAALRRAARKPVAADLPDVKVGNYASAAVRDPA